MDNKLLCHMAYFSHFASVDALYLHEIYMHLVGD